MNHDLLTDIVTKLLAYLSLECTSVTVTVEDDVTRIEIASPEASRVIGWHGETLNALQHLVKSIVRSAEHLEKTPFIVLDVDGYRKMQEDKVRVVAEQKADFVRRTGSRIALQPMSPYFRRIVHLHVAHHPELQDLTTESIGEGDYRQIILRLKDEQKGPKSGEELSPVIAAAGEDGLENLDI